MRSRWLSTFTVIGVVLIALGVYALVNHSFVFDPGQVPDHYEPWYYIIVGVLSIVNGIFTPPNPSDDKSDDDPGTVSGGAVASRDAG